jgi:hypothetical protein
LLALKELLRALKLPEIGLKQDSLVVELLRAAVSRRLNSVSLPLTEQPGTPILTSQDIYEPIFIWLTTNRLEDL